MTSSTCSRNRSGKIAGIAAAALFAAAVSFAEDLPQMSRKQAPKRVAVALEDSTMEIMPFAGIGSSFESYTGYTSYIKAGGLLRYGMSKNLSLKAGLGLSMYEQYYLISSPVGPYNVDSAAPVLAVAVPETKFDMVLRACQTVKDIAPGMDAEVFGGYKGIYLQNSMNPTNLHALNGGISAEYGVGNDMKAKGSLDIAYDPFGYSDTSSLMGSFNTAMAYTAGVKFSPSKGTKLEAGYEGEVLFFQVAERFYNGIYLRLMI
jgi:hypothetical protein